MGDATDPQTPLPSAQSALGIAIREELERLAVVRTAYSSERSLKAWMRTAVSLYTFGFAIATFFDYVELQQEGLEFSDGPRRLGLVLVAAGIVSLVLAVVEYLRRLATMCDLGLPHPSHYLLPAAAAAALTTIGIAAAISISLN